MATDINNMSAAASPMVLRDMSSREAAQSQVGSTTTTVGQLSAEDLGVKKQIATAGVETVKNETKADSKSSALNIQVQELQDTATLKGWSVNFSVDQELDRTVIKVVDSETKETIRQIPSEEWMHTAKRLKEFSELSDKKPQKLEPGMLFDKKV